MRPKILADLRENFGANAGYLYREIDPLDLRNDEQSTRLLRQ